MERKALLAEAVAAHRAGNLARAEELYGQALAQQPGDPQASYLLGALRGQQGRHAEAEALLEAAHRAAPTNPAILLHLGNALQGLGRFEEAANAYGAALALKPGYDEALNNRGNALAALGRHERALDSFNRALAIQPGQAGYWRNRGDSLMALDHFVGALEDYEKAEALTPGSADQLNQMAMAALYACDWERQAGITLQLEAQVHAGAAQINPWTLTAYGADPALILRAARAMMAAAVPHRPEPLWRGERYGHDRIRIAYLSSDFRAHPVAFQIAQLLEQHDRTQFELIALACGGDDGSALRARIAKSCDQFHAMPTAGSETIARWLRAREVDVVVDLNGYTSGNRMTALAWRPAPVQASWLGYSGTTGADFVDYLIADAVTVPPAQAQHYSEKIARLPDSFFPLDTGQAIASPPTRAEAGLPDAGFVFCCFNRNWKITAALFDVWMRLLNQVPGSVLWLRQYTAEAGEILRRAATARGVAPERLVFAGRTSPEAHLARHQLADLFLDTLPYGAHATCADALLAGLPVVTQLGDSFAGRVGASLLTAAGLPEMIARDMEEYEQMALVLARDPARLKALRAKLGTNRATAPLFDTKRLVRNLEAVYAQMLAEKLPKN